MGSFIPKFQNRYYQRKKIMNRQIAILLIVLIIISLLFSAFALSQGKFGDALFVYPLLIIVYLFARRGKK